LDGVIDRLREVMSTEPAAEFSCYPTGIKQNTQSASRDRQPDGWEGLIVTVTRATGGADGSKMWATAPPQNVFDVDHTHSLEMTHHVQCISSQQVIGIACHLASTMHEGWTQPSTIISTRWYGSPVS